MHCINSNTNTRNKKKTINDMRHIMPIPPPDDRTVCSREQMNMLWYMRCFTLVKWYVWTYWTAFQPTFSDAFFSWSGNESTILICVSIGGWRTMFQRVCLEWMCRYMLWAKPASFFFCIYSFMFMYSTYLFLEEVWAMVIYYVHAHCTLYIDTHVHSNFGSNNSNFKQAAQWTWAWTANWI